MNFLALLKEAEMFFFRFSLPLNIQFISNLVLQSFNKNLRFLFYLLQKSTIFLKIITIVIVLIFTNMKALVDVNGNIVTQLYVICEVDGGDNKMNLSLQPEVGF